MEGKVKFFNRKKGFGFIHGDDGNDYFVHFTALPRGTFLRDNDTVSFEGAQGDRGLKAENVKLLSTASGAQPQFQQREQTASRDDDDDDADGNDDFEEEKN